MPIKKNLLMGAALLSIAVGGSAADIALKPGSAAAYVLKPARIVTSSAATTTTTTTTTTADQCGLVQASAAVGTCCNSTHTEHYNRGRATSLWPFTSFKAVGSGTALVGGGTNNSYLRKTKSDYWDNVGSCS